MYESAGNARLPSPLSSGINAASSLERSSPTHELSEHQRALREAAALATDDSFAEEDETPEPVDHMDLS